MRSSGGGASGSSGGMTPGVSYYVQVDPPTVQSGAFNIASGTVAGPFTVLGPSGGSTPTLTIDDQTGGSLGAYLAFKDFGLFKAYFARESTGFSFYVATCPACSADQRMYFSDQNNGFNRIVGTKFGVNSVDYTWPSSNASGSLTNDGSGGLTWTASSGGGGGGTTIWSKKDGANVDTSVSTINVVSGGGLNVTSSPSGQINISLSANSTYYDSAYNAPNYASTGSVVYQLANYYSTGSANALFLPIGVAATTYATQSDVTRSTTNITNTFNNYYSSGSTVNLFNLKTVDATTYQTIANVLTSTTQLNSQFNNYYSSGQTIGLFNLKTVDATTYATWQQVNMFVSNPSTIPFNVSIGSVTDDAYGSGWNGSSNVPTKNAIWDKIESLPASGGGGSGYIDVQDEGIDQIKRSTMNFVGTGVTVTDSGSITTITIPGGGSTTAFTVSSFTTAGTFTYSVPTTANSLDIWTCAGGGGGGAGNGQAAGSGRGGASGGGGAACVEVTISTNDIGATLGVIVGAGGGGGVGVAANNGGNGFSGSSTTVYGVTTSTFICVFGGGPGFGSQNAANSGGAGGGWAGVGGAGSAGTVTGGSPNVTANTNGIGGGGAGSATGAVGRIADFGGSSGGSGSALGNGFAGGNSSRGAGGGGGGGGITAATPGSSGTSGNGGGSGNMLATSGSGGAAGTGGGSATAGTPGANGSFGFGGSGGGGGGADNDSNSPAGGAGGYCGGGGGGGGGGTNTGGNGGAGGPGCVIIIPHY